ncbi:MAG: aspartate carbamoyltransferase catalytic subunit [Candidatus Calescibacterium sp.]|nr:aspartate carbamoyltransferase catalytic subunit [Candidatus Calescibacterium sp.]MCX7734334.1 aspartate carbamoyltransferase catalytic subunit [bacterium]MDW8087605.1 aspartate carbamoyltransferase catalytic subunit [Candidatus Calescibacterium sp.]
MKSLLSVDSLKLSEIQEIIDSTYSMYDVLSREIKKLPTLRGKVISLMFFEPSTRTRISFEIASKLLSADIVNFSPSGSSVEKGENLLDTANTILSLGADLIVVRHSREGVPWFIFERLKIPVVNAGDGKNEHPTQALLDLFTMMKHKSVKNLSEFRNVQVSIVGDILHSRVARSNIKLLSKIGARVILVSAYTTLYQNLPEGVKVKNFIDNDVLSSDFIIALRLQRERHGNAFYPSEREYFEFWGVKQDLVEKAKGLLIMHPGPMNMGVEIDQTVAYSENSLIFDQVKNGVAVRMAVLYYLLTKGRLD